MTDNGCKRCGGKGYLGNPGGPHGSVAVPCPDCQRPAPASPDRLEARFQELLNRVVELEKRRDRLEAVIDRFARLESNVSELEAASERTLSTFEAMQVNNEARTEALTGLSRAVQRLKKSKCINCGKQIGGTVICNDCRVENVRL